MSSLQGTRSICIFLCMSARTRDFNDARGLPQKLSTSIEELEGFAEIVAHDLKEPLRGIRQHIDLVFHDCENELPAHVRDLLMTIDRMAERVTDRIDALYRYTVCHRSAPVVTHVDPRQVIRDVLLDLQPWLDEHRARVTIVGPCHPVDCDPALLTEVFHNLIANGVKYNDRPEPCLQVGRNREGAFFVQDDGIGIDPEHQRAIFEMYRRLHGRGRYGGGTGAGLAIVKRLIERHGGSIWVESQLGEGSTFFFTLGGCE
jgi:two-component system, chemotaxis family, sensor kinase Cph1